LDNNNNNNNNNDSNNNDSNSFNNDNYNVNNNQENQNSQNYAQGNSNPYAFNDYPSNDGMYGAPQGEPVRLKQSGPGIASFIIAILAVLLIIAGIISAGMFVSDVANDQNLLDELMYYDEYGDNFDFDLVMPIIVMMICFFAAVGLSVIGLILGIVGTVMKNRRKAFGIIGLILNALITVGAVGLFIIGLASGAAMA